MFFSNNWILFLHPLAFYSTFYELKREAVRWRRNEEDWVQVSFGRDGQHSCMVQFDLLPPPPRGTPGTSPAGGGELFEAVLSSLASLWTGSLFGELFTGYMAADLKSRYF